MPTAPLSTLLWVLVIFVAGAVAMYFANRMPGEMSWIARIVVAVVCIVALIFLLVPGIR